MCRTFHEAEFQLLNGLCHGVFTRVSIITFVSANLSLSFLADLFSCHAFFTDFSHACENKVAEIRLEKMDFGGR